MGIYENETLNTILQQRSIEQYRAHKQDIEWLRGEILVLKEILAILCSHAPNNELKISKRDLLCIRALRYGNLEFIDNQKDQGLIIRYSENHEEKQPRA